VSAGSGSSIEKDKLVANNSRELNIEGMRENRSLSIEMPVFSRWKDGGAEGVRTPDLLNAIQALYQLSYDPIRSDGNCKGPPRIVKTKQRNVLTFDAGTLAFSGE
jgi:hypothetical protein